MEREVYVGKIEGILSEKDSILEKNDLLRMRWFHSVFFYSRLGLMGGFFDSTLSDLYGGFLEYTNARRIPPNSPQEMDVLEASNFLVAIRGTLNSSYQ